MLKLPSVSISKEESAVFSSFAVMYLPLEMFEMLEGLFVASWVKGWGGGFWG